MTDLMKRWYETLSHFKRRKSGEKQVLSLMLDVVRGTPCHILTIYMGQRYKALKILLVYWRQQRKCLSVLEEGNQLGERNVRGRLPRL